MCKLLNRSVTLAESRWLVLGAYDFGAGAQDGPAAQAPVAVSAEDGKTGDDPVARLEVGHLLAHGLHRAAGLMPQNYRHRRVVFALYEVEVAMANAGSAGANQDLTGAGVIYLDVLNLEGCVQLSPTLRPSLFTSITGWQQGSFNSPVILNRTEWRI